MTKPSHVVTKSAYFENGPARRRIRWVVLSYEEKPHLLWVLRV